MDSRELVEDLLRLMEVRILDPLEMLLASDAAIRPVRVRLRARAEELADRLLGGDDAVAVQTTATLIAALFPGDGPFDPPAEWWGTALGQAVVRRIGHPTAAAVPFSTAGAMLGITRQGVHDLVKRGKLSRHPDGGVTTVSIRTRLDPSRSVPT